MAKGGLLNQVPRVDLPTTMDCNVVSIGGQTPEEYANLIAQKVAGKSNPGEYGSGSISGSPTLGKRIKFDGIEWCITKVDSNGDIYAELVDTTIIKQCRWLDRNTGSVSGYNQSVLRTKAIEFEKSLSNAAQSILKVPNNNYVINKNNKTIALINDKVWAVTLDNLSGVDDKDFGYEAREEIGNLLNNKNILKFDYFEGLTNPYVNWMADMGPLYYAYYCYESSAPIGLESMTTARYGLFCICLDKSKL